MRESLVAHRTDHQDQGEEPDRRVHPRRGITPVYEGDQRLAAAGEPRRFVEPPDTDAGVPTSRTLHVRLA